LVGYNSGTISSSYSTGSVSGTSYYIGGLVGYHYGGTISSSYSTGSVSSIGYAGGLVGYSYGPISNSYSLGDIYRLSGTSTYFGGFVGSNNYRTITNCYSTGRVSGSNWTPTDKGFSGNDLSTYGVNNFWDIDTSLQTTSGTGATGKTYAQMKTQSTFVDWDFTTIWLIETGISYPYLQQNVQTSHPKPSHSVISNQVPGTHYVFSLDITLTSATDDIYYTTNGTDPNCSGLGTEYTSPITITTGITTIKATGCKTGFDNRVFSFIYILPEPIIILNPTDLNNIRNDLGAFYGLGADIDLNISPYNEDSGWTPIGTSLSPFTGIINGNGYTINNLYINRLSTSYQGLFGYIGTGSVINNIQLEDINVSGNSDVGGLVGYQNGGSISSSYSSGFVFGMSSRVSGLVGYGDSGSISSSYSTGFVSGTSYVGGLVGYCDGVSISSSYSTGSVSGTSSIGGLVGNQSSGSISSSYSTGSVSGTSSIGGLVGYQYNGTISLSYSTGFVSGTSYVGGLAGQSKGTISNSYSLGDVYRSSGTSTTYFGGFVGLNNYRTITNCYSTGRVYSSNWTPTDKGFSGYNLYSGAYNFWDKTTSLQTTSGTGAIGKTTAEMKIQSTFTDWDFDTIWNVTEGTTYPYLIDNTPGTLPQ